MPGFSKSPQELVERFERVTAGIADAGPKARRKG